MRDYRIRRLNSKQIRLIVSVLVIALFVILRMWENNNIVTTNIVYSNEKIPIEFDGMKIVQISDLHNKKFGSQQKRLLDRVRVAAPDIIFITGDLIDRRTTNIDIAMDFVVGAMKIAPVYYVSGNHEAWSGLYPEILERLEASGVIIMDDAATDLEIDGGAITIIGLSDPAFFTTNYLEGTNTKNLTASLNRFSGSDDFKILLSHRPELIDIYADAEVDLAFTGHAHGGQIRLPFIGAIVAPDQGLFPKYTEGAHVQKDTTMIVSRGLGNSVIPIRTFNRPEIIVVTLSVDVGSPQIADEYIPYDKIPGSYSLEDAKSDNCVVFEDLDITAGQHVWDDFVAETQAGKPCMVRLAFYYTLGNPSHYTPEAYEELKDDYPLLYVQDLSFDGEKYNLFYTEEGKAYSSEYDYMKRLEGKPQSDTAEFLEYVKYVLVNDDDVTWEDIEKGMVSSQFGAYIDHQTVYSDYIY